MEDEQIIQLFFARDETALTETAHKYGSQLGNYALRIVSDPMDAEECVNDTYLKAWNTIPPQRPRYFYAYLSKICRFIAFGMLDKKHAAKRSAQMVEFTAEMEVCIPVFQEEPSDFQERLGELINAFLKELPKEKRMVFMRRYWYLDSVAQIAQRYQISESKVKTMLFRTRNRLRRYLEKGGITL